MENIILEPPTLKFSDAEMEPPDTQTTTDMFKDMLNQKRNMLLSKLTSFESDVSLYYIYLFVFI